MSHLKSLWFSVVAALILTTLLTVLGLNTDNKRLSKVFLWQYAIPAWVVYPGGPLLYVDKEGTPHYEGSPVMLLILPVGFLLGIPIYTVPIYLLLRWSVHRSLTNKKG